ncbi:MAG: hypothetical protein QOC82_2605 [Frankiaceae bacterium]|jgi:hypothetical protein|nr:hypothetical protein [Frankiaceae bacterium]
MKHRLTLAAALVLAPIVVTACNSSSTPSAGKSPPASPSSPAPNTSPSVGGDDKQRTAAIQLTAADLPTGWKSEAVKTTPAQQRAEDEYFDACLGVPTIETIQTTSSVVDFSRSDGFAFADGLVNVTTTEAQAQQDEEALTGPKAVDCAVATTKKFLTPPNGAKILSIIGSKLDQPEGHIGIRTIVTFQLSNGRKVTLTSDTIGIIVKRFEVQINFTGVVQPPQQSLEDSVSAKVFARAIANAS